MLFIHLCPILPPASPPHKKTAANSPTIVCLQQVPMTMLQSMTTSEPWGVKSDAISLLTNRAERRGEGEIEETVSWKQHLTKQETRSASLERARNLRCMNSSKLVDLRSRSSLGGGLRSTHPIHSSESDGQRL